MGNPSHPEEHIPICASCPACRNEILFPKINCEGSADVIFDLFCCSTVRYKTLEATIEYIRKYPNADYKIFRKRVKKIDPVLIKKFLFVMVAATILDVAFDSEIEKGGDVIFTLNRVDGNRLKMALMIDLYWENISLIDEQNNFITIYQLIPSLRKASIVVSASLPFSVPDTRSYTKSLMSTFLDSLSFAANRVLM